MEPQQTPSAQASAPLPPPPPPYRGQSDLRGDVTRPGSGWRWIAVAGCLVVIMCAAICLLTSMLFVYRAARSTALYSEALSRARSDPRLVSRLGLPIRGEWHLRGNLRFSGSPGNATGSADMTIPIRGPKGRASLHVVGALSHGRVDLRVLEAIFSDGTKIDLLPNLKRPPLPPDESVRHI